ncbi:MAG: TRM11 family SAM-dependent methyltransferase [Thermoplasmata archaeon]
MRVEVELSGEAPPLARAELEAVVAALGGTIPDRPATPLESPTLVDLPDERAVLEMMRRLSLARRCFRPLGTLSEIDATLEAAARGGVGAAFRVRGHPTGGDVNPAIRSLARRWTSAGGKIDLEEPSLRYWIDTEPSGHERLLVELGTVDRRAVAARRISRLPFRRPVGLDPRLARAAANLAGAAPGRSIVDPFVGTGALVAEAALLGASVVGIDRDPEMIRGAARNLEHVGRSAERLVAGDAEAVAQEFRDRTFDALLTDVPYGRSSGTGGEEIERLLARALPPWADLVRPGGRVVIVCAGGPDPIAEPWRRLTSIPVRQHRSLTREFRVYENGSTGR